MGRTGASARGDAKRERDERLIARVVDDGITYAEVGAEFGVTRQRAQQVVQSHFDRIAAEQAALDVEERALRVRYACAAELADTVSPGERLSLLAAVVWPSPALAEASRARAQAIDARTLKLERRRCIGCGIAFLAGHTDGCRECVGRARSTRRRVEAREQARTRHVHREGERMR